MNNTGKNLAIWVAIALVLVVVFNIFESDNRNKKVADIPYSEFFKGRSARTDGQAWDGAPI